MYFIVLQRTFFYKLWKRELRRANHSIYTTMTEWLSYFCFYKKSSMYFELMWQKCYNIWTLNRIDKRIYELFAQKSRLALMLCCKTVNIKINTLKPRCNKHVHQTLFVRYIEYFTISNAICLVNPQNGSCVLFTILRFFISKFECIFWG